MKISIIGLGRMGLSIVSRLIKAGHTVWGYDPQQDSRTQAEKLGACTVSTIEELAGKTTIVWLMVPAGEAVDKVLSTLKPILQAADVIIDGGNSNFHETIRRHNDLQKCGIEYLDCGTSGGLKGREIGFSLMIGGNKKAFNLAEELFKAIAAKDGYGYMGPSGSGHYVKMIHNGIEYALLQAYAEGVHLIKEGHYPNLDLEEITKVWSHGSVIRSWITDLLNNIFTQDQNLESISGSIDENKTGRWTLEEAKKQGVPIDLIERSLDIRAWSRESGGNFGTKVVAMLRNQFGGHPIKKKD